MAARMTLDDHEQLHQFIPRRRLGRSIVMRGHHARRRELPSGADKALALPRRLKLRLPIDLPSFVMIPVMVAAFNQV